MSECVHRCVFVCVTHLCDHGEAQDEEGRAADQREERLVFPQVLGELVRHRCDDGLDGGKLGGGGRRETFNHMHN